MGDVIILVFKSIKLTRDVILLTLVLVDCVHKNIDKEISDTTIIFKQSISFPNKIGAINVVLDIINLSY